MSADDETLFSRRVLFWLILLGSISLISAFALGIFLDPRDPGREADANGYSISAVGHRAFLSFLRESGIPVVTSRHESIGRHREDAVIVVAEPDLEESDRVRRNALRELLSRSQNALIILPKRYVSPDPADPALAGAISDRPLSRLLPILEISHAEGSVVRPAATEPPIWTTTGNLPQPEIDAPQLLTTRSAEKLVWTDAGALAVKVERPRQTIIVVSDPDLIENHGLWRGHNAELALALLGQLRKSDDAPVIVDETLHGFVRPRSLFVQLFGFPLVLATAQVLLAVVLALWSGIRRFGPALRRDPPFVASKRFLIENTAALLYRGRHHGESLARMLETVVGDAVRRGSVRTVGTAQDMRAGLAKLGRARGTSEDLLTIAHDVDALRADRRAGAPEVLAVARRLHRWTVEFDRPGQTPAASAREGRPAAALG